MWRLNRLGRAFVVACAIGVITAPLRADDVAAYLERHGLIQLLTVHLEQQLAAAAPGPERENLVNRLASLYAQLLESTPDAARRADLEERGRRVLAAAGGEGADDLRLALMRGTYRRAEKIAENHRLRLSAEADVVAATTDFAELIAQLSPMRTRLLNDIQIADRRLMRSSGTDSTDLSMKVQQTRNLLGQTNFMLAWSAYYQAWLSARPDSAKAAQTLFAELLDIPTAAPRPQDVTVDLRSVEAIARAILGMALCKSLTASSATALDWLALLEHEQAHAATRQEVPAWKLAIYLEQGEFDRAQRVWEAQLADDKPMPLAWMRLVAVHALEAQKADSAALRLAQLAVKELAARGELEQILALADRYGVESLGESGFALRYVRGMQLYQRARKEHGQDRPASETRLKLLYHDSAVELAAAVAQPDASGFEAAAASAQSLIGWCEYFQGELTAAAASFEHAAQRLAPEQAPEALWMAIVCLDALSESQQDGDHAAQLSALIDRFLTLYPTDAHAPRLVLRQAQAAEAPSSALIDQLLSVPSGSESWLEAQRRAAQMLYQLFRSAQAGQRQSFGSRYLDVADGLLAREAPQATGSDAGATDRFLVTCRRVLEIALSEEVNQPAAATRALEAFDELAAVNPASVAAVMPEIDFRRAQSKLRAGDAVGAETIADRLWNAEPQSKWAALAARAVFKHAADAWRAGGSRNADDQPLLERLVRHGQRVLLEYEKTPQPGATTDDEAARAIAVRAAVADASMTLWEHHKQELHGREAMALFRTLLAARPRDVGYLRSAAILGEAFGDKPEALEHWRVLVAGSSVGTDGWYEAKFNVIRLLEQLDLARAREVMDQHKLLNPDYGPEPWGSRLRALDRRLNTPREGGPQNAPPGGGS